MTLICIECRKEFETLDEAYKHTNPLATKDGGKGGVVRIPLKRHLIFPKTVAAPKSASSNG